MTSASHAAWHGMASLPVDLWVWHQSKHSISIWIVLAKSVSMSALLVLPPLPYSSHELWSPRATNVFGSPKTSQKLEDQEWLYATPLLPSCVPSDERHCGAIFPSTGVEVSPSSYRPVMVTPPPTIATRDGIPTEIVVVIKRPAVRSVDGRHEHCWNCPPAVLDDDVSVLHDDPDHEGGSDNVEMDHLPEVTYNVVHSLLMDDADET